MDRSYLSDQAVVKASRDFVCIRLSTYEDQGEADFMSSIYRFRGGKLKNSLFAIMDPRGEKHLVKAGRSPKNTYRDGAAMAKSMRTVAKQYPAQQIKVTSRGLPYLKSVRLALNVTSCDSQRLLIVYGKKAAERKALEQKLLALAWSDAVIGKFLYAQCSDPTELESISDAVDGACVIVVEPDAFGLKGTVLDRTLLSQVSRLKKMVLAATDNDQGSTNSKRQVGRGRRKGVKWETEIEVEDKGQVDPNSRRRRRRR